MYKRSSKLVRTMHQRTLKCKRVNDELLNLDYLLSVWGTSLGTMYWMTRSRTRILEVVTFSDFESGVYDEIDEKSVPKSTLRLFLKL